jgi:hypothetical protein
VASDQGKISVSVRTLRGLTQEREAHIYNYGDNDRTCRRWTDQCRICTRDNGGATICSNIGIACQPAKVECTARDERPGTQHTK